MRNANGGNLTLKLRQVPEARAQEEKVVQEKTKGKGKERGMSPDRKGKGKGDRSDRAPSPNAPKKRGKSPSGKEDALPGFNYLKGKCQKGNECDYWHPPKCKFFMQGDCSAGKGCSFLHPASGKKAAPAPKAKS